MSFASSPLFTRPNPVIGVVIGLVFTILTLTSISLLKATIEVRTELRHTWAPILVLTANVETSSADTLSAALRYQTTGASSQQRKFSEKRHETIRALGELDKLVDTTMNDDLQRKQAFLHGAVNHWFEQIDSRGLLTERMDRTDVLVEFSQAQALIEKINVAASNLREGFSHQLERQRERIDHLDLMNFIVLATIAGLGLFSALAAFVEVRRLDTQGRQLKTGLRVRNEALQIVSHDLKNPISNIAVASQLMSNEQVSSGLLRSYVGIIQRSVNRMQNLTQDLLDVARLESGNNLELQRTDFNIEDLITDACDNSRALAGKGDIRLTWQSEGATLHADRRRLSQAMTNLLDNAIKFTPAGGEVSVRCRREGPEVVIRVSDTGPGVPPSDYEAIFEPFRRTQPGVEGSGLGLAIVKGIAEQHGGRIWVSSNPAGQGSMFSLAIPLPS